MTNPYLDIDYIVSQAQMIHSFGLGFIQVKFDKYNRAHYYSPDLPVTVGDEEIHNHRYNFASTILKGLFVNKIYHVVDGVTHLMKDESCMPDSPAIAEGKLVGLEHFTTQTHKASTSYYMHHETFHTVETEGNAITLLKRTDYRKEFAQVVSKVGSSVVCPFSVDMSRDELIDHIKAIINS